MAARVAEESGSSEALNFRGAMRVAVSALLLGRSMEGWTVDASMIKCQGGYATGKELKWN